MVKCCNGCCYCDMVPDCLDEGCMGTCCTYLCCGCFDSDDTCNCAQKCECCQCGDNCRYKYCICVCCQNNLIADPLACCCGEFKGDIAKVENRANKEDRKKLKAAQLTAAAPGAEAMSR